MPRFAIIRDDGTLQAPVTLPSGSDVSAATGAGGTPGDGTMQTFTRTRCEIAKGAAI